MSLFGTLSGASTGLGDCSGHASKTAFNTSGSQTPAGGEDSPVFRAAFVKPSNAMFSTTAVEQTASKENRAHALPVAWMGTEDLKMRIIGNQKRDPSFLSTTALMFAATIYRPKSRA
jgi:hypothetical protein